MTNATDIILHNAAIVLPERVIGRGWLAMAGGRIAEIGEGAPPELGIDCGGDLVAPGLVELHTDHLEAHAVPRPKVIWDRTAAVIAYDAQMATCGVTTVLDSLRVWREESAGVMSGEALAFAEAIADARYRDLLRSDHYLHMRCEIPTPDVVEDAQMLIARPDVRLLSLMDHTPGQRQFRDPQKMRDYYRGKTGGLSDPELDELFLRRIRMQKDHAEANMEALVALARTHGVPTASHDDTTLEHAERSIADGVAVAEFPTSVEAALTLHQAGVKVLMGAPNLVRGGSHSGNVATAELAQAGALDIMSSDYVPSSLLMAALALPDIAPRFDLAAALRTVTATPAAVVGLTDRGELAPGKRADVIRIHRNGSAVVVRAVWRAGERVA